MAPRLKVWYIGSGYFQKSAALLDFETLSLLGPHDLDRDIKYGILPANDAAASDELKQVSNVDARAEVVSG